MDLRDEDKLDREEATAGPGGSGSVDRDAREGGVERAEATAERIEDLPAPDGAAGMERMTPAMSADVAEALDPETAGQILSEMDATLAASVIADMEVPEASMVLEAMDPDDRGDILEHIGAAPRDRLVDEMATLEAGETG